MSVLKAILVASDVPVAIALVYTAVLYRRLGRSLKVFAVFVFVSALIQLASLGLWAAHTNNLPLVHIYVPLGFLCLAWFYSTVLGSFVDPRIIWYTAMAFVLFSVLNTAFIQPVHIFNSYALVTEAVLVIILALFTFLFFLNDTMRDTGIPDIKALTWINSGLFVYYLSSLLIYYFSNVTIFDPTAAIRKYPWVFHSFFSMVMYSCFLTGLWKRSKIPD